MDDVNEVFRPRLGDGAVSPAELLAVSREHSCVLPLLPYTSRPGTWAHQESDGSITEQGLLHYVGVSLLLLHQEKVFSASCFSEHFGITSKASPSKSKYQQSV